MRRRWTGKTKIIRNGYGERKEEKEKEKKAKPFLFLLSPLSYKDKWTLNWRSVCTIPLTLVFSCKRWKHSRPPVRVILAWKNRDEKIEASSEEGRRETQPAKDCSGSRNNLRVSNKVDQSQIMGIIILYRVFHIDSPKVFAYCSKNMITSDILSLMGAHKMWSIW